MQKYAFGRRRRDTLPHMLRLGADMVTAWSRIVAGHGVVQPFDQLGRATYVPGATRRRAETDASQIANRSPVALEPSIRAGTAAPWADG